ncbi:MAG: hypothetical protein IAE80_20950 [Anaerolinea sp.]|nr:hypothetical protein [Anaerolinea sp.]
MTFSIGNLPGVSQEQADSILGQMYHPLLPRKRGEGGDAFALFGVLLLATPTHRGLIFVGGLDVSGALWTWISLRRARVFTPAAAVPRG